MRRVRPLAIAAALSAMLAITLLPGTSPVVAESGTAETWGRGMPYTEVMPALLPNAKENTSVIAQNNGNAAATIAMDIYLPTGVLVPSASKVETNVPPGGTRTFAQAINNGLVPGFRGVGLLSSDQPINALLSRDIEENGTATKSYSLHNAYGSGSMLVTLPYISNALGGIYNTRFAAANTGTSVACITIFYAFDGGGSYTDNGPGGGGCGTGYPIPVGGQVAFGPNAVPAEATQAMPAQTAGKLMAATVTATGAPITVAVDAYLTNYPARKLASYDGFNVGSAGSNSDDIGTEIAIPLAIKLDGFYSQILLSNTNATEAHAVITYRSQGGQTYVVNRTVPANGTANSSVYDPDSGIPEGFVGAATITSDQAIAAVLFRSKMTSPGSYVDEPLYTAVSGVPTDRATTTAKLPLSFRRAYGNNLTCNAGGTTCGYNTWISVLVIGGGTANLTLTTVGDTTTGAPGCTNAGPFVKQSTIIGSFVFYLNLNVGQGDNGLGQDVPCLWGGTVIQSDVPILAIADVTTDLYPGDNDGLYNAFTS